MQSARTAPASINAFLACLIVDIIIILPGRFLVQVFLVDHTRACVLASRRTIPPWLEPFAILTMAAPSGFASAQAALRTCPRRLGDIHQDSRHSVFTCPCGLRPTLK